MPRRLLDNLTTAVLLLDARLIVRDLNPAAEELLTDSARRMRGAALDRRLPGNDGFVAALRRALETGRPCHQREQRLQLAPDRTITADITATPLAGPQPELLLELRPRDWELRLSQEAQLLAQQKAVRVMLRGLAHEIRNPLSGLRGAAQLLERELERDDLKDYTRFLMGEVDRLRALMDSLLGPSSRPEKTDLDVHEVVERVYQLLCAEAAARIRIERDYDPSIPPVHADRDLLIQALLNIGRNALAAVQCRDDAQGEIRLRTRIERGCTIGRAHHRLTARIDVIDNGPGIAPELVEQIFYPMTTSREQGSGLGLTIAQSIVQAHGGLIECSSRPGKTEFCLLLPIQESENG